MEAVLSQLLSYFLLVIISLSAADGSWIQDNLEKIWTNQSNMLVSCGIQKCDLSKDEFCQELFPGRPMCQPCSGHCGRIHEDSPSEDCVQKCPLYLQKEELLQFDWPTIAPVTRDTSPEVSHVMECSPYDTFLLICLILVLLAIFIFLVCIFRQNRIILRRQNFNKGAFTPESTSLMDPESRFCCVPRRTIDDAQAQELQVLNERQPENDGSGSQGGQEPASRASTNQLQTGSHTGSTPQSQEQRLHSASQGNSTGSLDQGQSSGSVSHQTSRSNSAQLQAEAQTKAVVRPDALRQISPVGSSTPIQSHLSHTLPKRQRLLQQDTFHASGDSSNLTTPLQLESNAHNLHQAQRTGSFHQPVSSHYAQTSDAITSPIQESNHLLDRPYNSDNVQ